MHRPRFELYDLEQDPDEVTNLAGRPEYAEMVDAFCAKLRRFQEDTEDPWLHKWVYEWSAIQARCSRVHASPSGATKGHG